MGFLTTLILGAAMGGAGTWFYMRLQGKETVQKTFSSTPEPTTPATAPAPTPVEKTSPATDEMNTV